jgi:hypothetical protein
VSAADTPAIVAIPRTLVAEAVVSAVWASVRKLSSWIGVSPTDTHARGKKGD